MMMPHIQGFFVRRLNSGVRLHRLLWRDMIGIGTLVNLCSSFLAAIMLVEGVAGGYALLVHLAPLPYNLFLLLAVWRSTERTPFAIIIGSLWLALVTIV
jgi:hypothetical protein